MTLTLQHGIKSLICFICITISFQSVSQKKITRKEKRIIIKQIDSLLIEDQKYRMPILYGTMDTKKIDSMQQLTREEKNKIHTYAATSQKLRPFRDSLFSLIEPIDSSNFTFLIKIFNEYGYPSFYKKKYGLIVIIEHCIADYPEYLDTLKGFMEKGKITPWDYSTIYDRYLQLIGNNLMYYTRGKYEYLPCDTCCTANKARKEIGIKKMMKCNCDD